MRSLTLLAALLALLGGLAGGLLLRHDDCSRLEAVDDLEAKLNGFALGWGKNRARQMSRELSRQLRRVLEVKWWWWEVRGDATDCSGALRANWAFATAKNVELMNQGSSKLT